MSDQPKIYRFPSFDRLVTRLRDDFQSGGHDFVLLYGYNGTGKTRLSMEFKAEGKNKNAGAPDTLYFNAYTEDLFIWDNDLEGDTKRVLRLNSNSRFFSGIKELALDENIQSYLGRYTDLEFDIDYTNWTVSFTKGESQHIKASRGEENIFIWCLFLAICERVILGHSSYDWVKYFYIDDPISSLDDNNAIAVASDLAKLLRQAKDRTKLVEVVEAGAAPGASPTRNRTGGSRAHIMTEQNQTQLGKTLWNIADQLRGAMDADDFRDYSHIGDAGPEVFRLNDVMYLAPHLFFKLDDIVGVVRIPEGERHAAIINF